MSETANQDGAGLTVEQAAHKYSESKRAQPKKEREEQPEAEVNEVETEEQQPQESQSLEADESSSETEATETEPETSYERLEQFAEALEMPLDEFLGKIKAKVKIAGAEKEVTLNELRNGYQMESDYRRKTTELSEHRKAFEAEREQIKTEMKSRLDEAVNMTKMVEDQILQSYNSVNWAALKAENPGQYAATLQEYQMQYAAIQTAKQRAIDQQKKLAEEADHKRQQELNSWMQSEREKTLNLIPELSDPAKGKQMMEGMTKYLSEQSFHPIEIAQIHDHRFFSVIRDAMKYRELANKKPELTNKVKTAPKLLKPGAKSTTSQNESTIKETP